MCIYVLHSELTHVIFFPVPALDTNIQVTIVPVVTGKMVVIRLLVNVS